MEHTLKRSQTKKSALLTTIIFLTASNLLLATSPAQIHAQALEPSIFNPTLKFNPHATEEFKKPGMKEKWEEFNSFCASKLTNSQETASFAFITADLSNYNFEDQTKWGKVAVDFPYAYGISGHERLILYFKRVGFLQFYFKMPVEEGGYLPEGVSPGIYSFASSKLIRRFNFGKIFPDKLGGTWPVYVAMDSQGQNSEGLGFSFESAYSQKGSSQLTLEAKSFIAKFDNPDFPDLKQYLGLPREPTDSYFRSQEDADNFLKLDTGYYPLKHFKVLDWDYSNSHNETGGGCKSALAELKGRLTVIKEKIDALSE